MSPRAALQKAVKIAGGQSATAKICKVTQPSVWRWLHVTKRVPAEHVLLLESQTGVARGALRPDIYPVEGAQ